MSEPSLFHRVGNHLYKYVFSFYRPLYTLYKAHIDRAERQLLKRILFPGAIVVDAGANIGVYSKFLSRWVGPAGVVHSFEPSPENFKRLRVATRKLSNVRLSQVAVGEHSGKAHLYISDKLNVDHRAYMADGTPRRAIPIEMLALDDYFQPEERVDLIKFDIQGYELHALRGARRIVHENPAIKLLLEFWPYGLQQAGSRWEDLIGMLRAFGMEIALVRNEGLKPFNAADVRTGSSAYVNLLASRG
jgi:FkbM family methyltransferase